MHARDTSLRSPSSLWTPTGARLLLDPAKGELEQGPLVGQGAPRLPGSLAGWLAGLAATKATAAAPNQSWSASTVDWLRQGQDKTPARARSITGKIYMGIICRPRPDYRRAGVRKATKWGQRDCATPARQSEPSGRCICIEGARGYQSWWHLRAALGTCAFRLSARRIQFVGHNMIATVSELSLSGGRMRALVGGAAPTTSGCRSRRGYTILLLELLCYPPKLSTSANVHRLTESSTCSRQQVALIYGPPTGQRPSGPLMEFAEIETSSLYEA